MNRGDPNHLLNGMILQVVGGLLNRPNLEKNIRMSNWIGWFALIVPGKDKNIIETTTDSGCLVLSTHFFHLKDLLHHPIESIIHL